MHSTTQPHIFVSTSTGEVNEVNPAAAKLFGKSRDAIIGLKLKDLIQIKNASDPVEELCSRALEGSSSISAKLAGADTAVHPTMFRVSGERLLLCRLTATGDTVEHGGDLPAQLFGLFESAADGIIFTNSHGQLLSANDGFLDLIGLAHTVDVKGRNITDFLLRGSVDFKVMSENARRYGRMRLYATKIASDYGSPRNVEISVSALKASAEDVLSFIIRDANRSEAAKTPMPQKNEDVQSVVELVGTATLKEIVAESTDVIERMCIETAIELTMNNRVAAAEMLGLSRQSLYVKLRKLGILSSDT